MPSAQCSKCAYPERLEKGFVNQRRFEVVQGAGHCPWLDKPDECVTLLLKMLKN
jgi:pimeloyl-ACP methyl ester carboxylesterase